jgi:hypothetical protein
MKKICKLCYREFDEEFMKGNYCFTCLEILGKGAGYKDRASVEKAEKWFEGAKERKEKLEKEGRL